MNRFYITTPLYYINDKPHLGTAYSTVIADVLNRFHQLLGYETFFLTGTDEHGQKSAQAAKQKNIPPRDYCDQMSQKFKDTWSALNISYSLFFRTTADGHKKAVQKCLRELYNNKHIYSADYEGWYCVSEELFYTSKDLVDGKSPSKKEVVKIKEKNYFFKMSAFQKPLIEHILNNPGFIQPPHRKNEVLGFLKQDLADLCISRPKSRLSWGVPIPFDPDYVTYVWVDALLNYVTGVGGPPAVRGGNSDATTYPDRDSGGPPAPVDRGENSAQGEFAKWWEGAGAVHLIGKDILLTHCVYWPCLLMALKIKLPKTIMAHGWLLNQSQEKMSKSTGDVMDPLSLLSLFDSDSLRYFLIRDVPLGNDAPVSHALIARRINEDLANNLGNLLRRITKMLNQHFNSLIPQRANSQSAPPLTAPLRQEGLKTLKSVKQNILNLQPHPALESIIHLLNETNKFLEQNAPWKTIKTDKQKTEETLRQALEAVYLSAVLLKPIMPKKMDRLLNSLACPDEWPEEHFKTGAFPKAGEKIQELPPLFPRVNL